MMSTFPDEALEVIDSDHRIRDGGFTGCWELERRIADMDREGIAAELLLTGTSQALTPFFGHANNPFPPEVCMAGVRAYDRWLADVMAEVPGRLFAVAHPGPCLDMDATLAELAWVAERDFVSVSVPGVVAHPALPPLFDPYYEPFWKACAERGLVLSVHAGHGKRQGEFLDFARRIRAGNRTPADIQHAIVDGIKGSPFELDMVPARVMYGLMLAGVFDRYPSLRLALTEVRSDWVPATLAVLDRRFDAGDTPLRKRPSEYWQTNCWVGASSIKQSEVRLRDAIGADRMMFGRDYPHPEGTWPNTWDWLRDALAGFSETDIRAILGGNALRCYGIEEGRLRPVAERIGPRPRDIMCDDPAIDPRMIDHFDHRGGYRKSAEMIDVAALEAIFDEDLALASH
jgi:predicted TIM-barrel fold metal-dependent hydrolase